MLRLLLALVCVFGFAELRGVANAQGTHRVRSGESLARIARRHRVQVWDLALANGIRPTSPIRPGQSLEVPPSGVVYVRPGQTLSHIARAHEITIEELRRRNRLRPGARLQVGRRLLLPGYEPTPRRARDWGSPELPGVVTIRRRAQRVQLRLVDGEGRVLRGALEPMRSLMRRHESDVEEREVHPRLLAVLAAISDHFGGRELTIVSGLRNRGGFTRGTSRHVAGHASDIRVRGVSNRELWQFCLTLAGTGCGYYPRSSFVHVDVRERHGQWVDWSRPGRRPRYGTLRRPYRPRERRGRRPTIGRRITRAELVPAEIELADGEALLSSEIHEEDAQAAEEEQALDSAEAEGEGEPGSEPEERGEALAEADGSDPVAPGG